jgi:hypothetical protein
MARSRISGPGLPLTLGAAGLVAGAALLAGPAVHAAGQPAARPAAVPARPALSVELMPVCGPGAMINVAQAALGQPRPTGPASPVEAVAEFAATVDLVLPAGAPLQRTVSLSESEAVVQGAAAIGHAVRHGNHWQADYLATCVPTAPTPALPAAPGDLPLQVPALPDATGLGQR